MVLDLFDSHRQKKKEKKEIPCNVKKVSQNFLIIDTLLRLCESQSIYYYLAENTQLASAVESSHKPCVSEWLCSKHTLSAKTSCRLSLPAPGLKIRRLSNLKQLKMETFQKGNTQRSCKSRHSHIPELGA